MGVLLSPRSYRRPDQPQPVYPQVVDATVRTWAPVWAAEHQSVRTGARPSLDVRGHEWAPFGWVPSVVERVVATWGPAFQSELKGERSADHARLDVRGHEWNSWGWLPRVSTDPIVAQWAAIWNASVRTPDRPGLDVCRAEWSAPAWIFQVLPSGATVAQQWPALLQALGLSYRSPDRIGLDVRGVAQPDFAWPSRVVDAVVQTWLPAITSELRAERTAARPALDVRQYEWLPQPAWLFTNLPPAVSIAQQWPAVLQALGLSYRMADRLALDVRADLWAPESGWLQKVVDGVLSRYAPVFSAELHTFRSAERARLDVRGYEWLPAFGWVQRPVDAVVSRWAPIFNAEVGLWTPSRSVLDVRLEWFSEWGWVWTSLPVITASVPVGDTRVRLMTRRAVVDSTLTHTVRPVTARRVRPVTTDLRGPV